MQAVRNGIIEYKILPSLTPNKLEYPTSIIGKIRAITIRLNIKWFSFVYTTLIFFSHCWYSSPTTHLLNFFLIKPPKVALNAHSRNASECSYYQTFMPFHHFSTSFIHTPFSLNFTVFMMLFGQVIVES